MGGSSGPSEAQAVAVEVGVVGEQGTRCQSDCARTCRQDGRRVVNADGIVVDRIDGEADCRRRAADGAVVGRESEGIRAVIIGEGRVGIGAVGVEIERAVGWARAEAIGQGIVVRIGGGNGAMQRHVFVGHLRRRIG